ncbi:MAG: rhomboid family intramembrane serine protease [Flavobacteriaceae bacterium]|jgi:membrane associated rhomboid family serine protease|nr:rhomboid family intramembrane serine protease [Flavobacteriaceae bacterium]
MLGLSPVLFLIILTNIIFSYKGFRNKFFFDRYKFDILKLDSGDLVRMISSGFLHVDYNHLIINMLTLYFFADYVVYGVGWINFLIIYMVSLLLGNYFSYKFHRKQKNYTAVGASGAVSGIVYSSILIFPDMRLAFIFFPIPMPGYFFAVGYLIYTIYSMKRQNDNVGHTAHFGGSIAGILVTLVIAPELFVKSALTLIILITTIPIFSYFIFKK